MVDSYMVSNEDLKVGDMKMLFCDSPCVVPFGVLVQFLIRSGDVLHSWAIPSLCVKVDAIPGINSVVRFWVPFPGLYLGMCSELCGAYHAYMPINLEATSVELFKSWVNSF